MDKLKQLEEELMQERAISAEFARTIEQLEKDLINKREEVARLEEELAHTQEALYGSL